MPKGLQHITVIRFTARDKLFHDQVVNHLSSSQDRSGVTYAHKTLETSREVNMRIADMISSGKPFCVGRFGAAELFAASSFELAIGYHQKKSFRQLHECAGFFPNDTVLGPRYNQNLIESYQHLDILGVSAPRYEQYYIQKYAPRGQTFTYLLSYEPWSCPEEPWTQALEGKKVLVIHPFVDTIQAQYEKREAIFPGTKILPEFTLTTLKAVQTSANQQTSEFADWFEALEWMYREAMKIDFDVAIVGCGAYGLPLCAMLKQAGKQAIQLAGATQILFGIKGKRWDEAPYYRYIRDFYNEAWVYPGNQEKPKDYQIVEGGCYW